MTSLQYLVGPISQQKITLSKKYEYQVNHVITRVSSSSSHHIVLYSVSPSILLFLSCYCFSLFGCPSSFFMCPILFSPFIFLSTLMASLALSCAPFLLSSPFPSSFILLPPSTPVSNLTLLPNFSIHAGAVTSGVRMGLLAQGCNHLHFSPTLDFVHLHFDFAPASPFLSCLMIMMGGSYASESVINEFNVVSNSQDLRSVPPSHSKEMHVDFVASRVIIRPFCPQDRVAVWFRRMSERRLNSWRVL